MATPREQLSTDVGAVLATLGKRVHGLEAATNKTEQDIAKLETRIELGFKALSDEISKRDRIPWGTIFTALGVLITFLGIIGALAYMPIKTEQAATQETVTRLQREIREDRRELEREKIGRDEFRLSVARSDKEYDRVERRLDRLEAELMWRHGSGLQPWTSRPICG